MIHASKLYKDIIKNKYCVGCGVCCVPEGSPFNITMKDGQYLPEYSKKDLMIPNICPMYNSEENETTIADELYSKVEGNQYNSTIGYYSKLLAFKVKDDSFRERSSSGGLGTWISLKLLEENYVDGIIHVRKSSSSPMFEYTISSTKEEITNGSKSRYFPIELSGVLKLARESGKKYALYGIPCFIKAVRLLSKRDEKVNKAIKFYIGLVCGHLKTTNFANALSFEQGIKPKTLTDIDFRVKKDNNDASCYAVKVSDGKVTKSALITDLYTTNWGHCMFKLKACDYCDDIFAETADLCIGDAWLPEYISDSLGTNIVVVRNNILRNIIDKYSSELDIEDLSPEKIIASQSAGVRHKQNGLSYRLYLSRFIYTPKKRVKASNSLPLKRKIVFILRFKIRYVSHLYFKISVLLNSFKVYKILMKPYLVLYKLFTRKSIISSLLNKFNRVVLRR